MMLLTGDIGGTKTVLALISQQKGVRQPIRESTYLSDDYHSLEEIINDFLHGDHVALTAASFGVAGPVVNNRAQITNLPWTIDAATISQQLNGTQVFLLNDLEAIATAIPHLQPVDLVTLNPGQAYKHGSIGVIAPGTGLGEAFLVWDGQRYQAKPSEGGHTGFGPSNKQQLDLLTYLQPIFHHVSYERVCSGSGIPNLYTFFRDSGLYHEPEWLHQKLTAVEDKTPVIINTAVAQMADICEATLQLFLEILGDEAGNLALTIMATGGIYLGGGIPPRILPQIQVSRFMDAFKNKGRFSHLMANIPIHIICNPKSGLYGAAYAGLARGDV